jgi:hypothetical protein
MAEARVDGLSELEAATLDSLEKIDDYPLYVMHYYGHYSQAASPADMAEWPASLPAARPRSRLRSAEASPKSWACSLFAALGDADNALYGRNFDWEYSPALLLFTYPPDGYASVSMVDIGYMLDQSTALALTDLPLVERKRLLELPYWPFDGMNEHGLVVGMAAVPGTDVPYDPGKETLGSLGVIREMLDHASDVNEALAIMQTYNVDMSGGPHIHYLIADALGQAVLVEFDQGQTFVFDRQDLWHLATNFLRARASNELEQCRRYDTMYERLISSAGQLSAPDAMELLSQVAQDHTQWSVVYEMSTGSVNVVVGREYDEVYTFDFAGD